MTSYQIGLLRAFSVRQTTYWLFRPPEKFPATYIRSLHGNLAILANLLYSAVNVSSVSTSPSATLANPFLGPANVEGGCPG